MNYNRIPRLYTYDDKLMAYSAIKIVNAVTPMLSYMAVIMCIIGVMMIIIPLWNEHRKMFRNGIAISAKIHKIERNKRHIYITWNYKYKGIEYHHRSQYSHKLETRKPGDCGTIMIKRGNPSKVYRFLSPKEKFTLIGIGLVLTIVSLIFMIVT